MNKQSTKPIFIETLRMWNWSQRVPVDSQGQGTWRDGWGPGGAGRGGGSGLAGGAAGPRICEGASRPRSAGRETGPGTPATGS